ncbi:MFS transporter [Terricaulis sp.]|uniref:MFS transporter n=1 Tax=Terricaulis sp. TaxID=2768686 RepID=UPI003782F45D
MTMTAVTSTRAPADFGAIISMAVIGVTAFLTVVDLFATQAILPALAMHYGVAPSAMGVAVNATTLGMALSGLGVALFSARINRRVGIMAALFLLAVPTFLLAFAQDLLTFTLLRVVQGMLMAAAFTLTLAHLGERCSARAAAGAFAAYITGNVASNLFGRLLAAGLVDHFGIAANFIFFAALNAAGGLLVFLTIRNAKTMGVPVMPPAPWAAFVTHLRNPALRTAFAIGFLILFAFIGVFTYVNFVLVRAPFSVAMMSLGLVYFVFLPAIVTTPLAGRVVTMFGARAAMWGGFGIALLSLPLLLAQSLPLVLAGMALAAVGTFFAQAVATGFVSRAATADRGAASGLYLASYFLGGLVGSAVVGQLFDRFGWSAAVAGVGVALVLASLLAANLCAPKASPP